jgi:hypothetical protein
MVVVRHHPARRLVALFERWRNVREHRYDEVILAAATKYGVDPALVKAVVWQESRSMLVRTDERRDRLDANHERDR